ncbi:hypothetical protein TIFTF001_040468 [Ficus carica]|uniref:Uncharacterized protein n=1 Tax=Ficus carica TaxID=3494 RepID=A0AA87YWE4_FICCA|nr:hypothetical protein TIFTF001_040468 [Ficus carica]
MNVIFTLQVHHESFGADIERIFGLQEETPLRSLFSLPTSGISTQSTVLLPRVTFLGSIVVFLPACGLETTLVNVEPLRI